MAKNWRTELAAPAEIVAQLDYLTSYLCESEGENLIGIYLHGSLAMGCFCPLRSDLDLLVLVAAAPPAARIRAWAEAILRLSGAPGPIEISILQRRHYAPWRHPTPFLFHYSEDWRDKIGAALADAQWSGQEWQGSDDPDLAGHFMVARRRGVCLFGAPIEAAIPAVPWADYQDSIVRDFVWACARAGDNPVYLVLNACRTWAAAAEQRVLSKAEGALWAQRRLPDDLAAVVAAAAAEYAGTGAEGGAPALDGSAALRVARWIEPHLAVAGKTGLG